MQTFRQLVDERYLARNFSRKAAFAIIYTQSGVSTSSLEAAYRGTRVLPETVAKLERWAEEYHRTKLDGRALLMAPPRAS